MNPRYGPGLISCAAWGAWRDIASIFACVFALPVSTAWPIAVVLGARGAAFLVTTIGLATGRPWAWTAWRVLWAITAIGMTVLWLAVDPIASSPVYAVLSSVFTGIAWRQRRAATT